jgi:hypothetical protein
MILGWTHAVMAVRVTSSLTVAGAMPASVSSRSSSARVPAPN